MAKQGTTPPADEHAAVTEGAGDTPPAGALAGLIAVEERVRTAIREAETEAARAIAAAEALAGEHAEAEDEALDSALRALEEEIAAERTAAVDAAASQSDEAVRRLSEIEPARIEELADLVARRIAEGESAGEGPAP